MPPNKTNPLSSDSFWIHLTRFGSSVVSVYTMTKDPYSIPGHATNFYNFLTEDIGKPLNPATQKLKLDK